MFSRFGVMFFEKPVLGFADLRRSLKATGRISMVVWQSLSANEWVTVPAAAVRRPRRATRSEVPTSPDPSAWPTPIGSERCSPLRDTQTSMSRDARWTSPSAVAFRSRPQPRSTHSSTTDPFADTRLARSQMFEPPLAGSRCCRALAVRQLLRCSIARGRLGGDRPRRVRRVERCGVAGLLSTCATAPAVNRTARTFTRQGGS